MGSRDEGNVKQTKAVLSVMVLMLLGKAAGLVRNILVGRAYGTGNVISEAFNYASSMPRTILDVLFASAFTASFIPVFSEYLGNRGKKDAFRLADGFITITLALSAVITLLLMWQAPAVMELLVNLNDDASFRADVIRTGVPLLRVIMPVFVFSAAAYCVTGVLQAMEEFNVPAMMSFACNMIIIGYMLFFSGRFDVNGLAVTFLIGWSTQLFIQLPALRRKGYRFRPRLNLKEPGIRTIGKKMLPIMAGSWAVPVNLFVNETVASRVAGGAAIGYASGIYTVIYGVFVFSVMNVLFTKFSKLNAGGKTEELNETVASSARGMLVFLIPLAAGLFVLAGPIIRVVFEGGGFTAQDTAVTAGALKYLAPGMVGYGLTYVLSQALYASGKTAAPLAASLVSIAVNAALSLVLVESMGAGGTALASSVAVTVSGVILFVYMVKKKIIKADARLTADIAKSAALAVTMAAAAYLCYAGLSGVLGDSRLGTAFRAGLAALAGVLWYALGACLTRVKEAEQIMAFLRNRFLSNRRHKAAEPAKPPKVMMVTMALNLGGAESHIVELARALRARGVDLIAVSAGGKYTEDLEACGVKHFYAPLHSKGLKNMISSYRTIKRVARENGVTVVHAHARIPAFICGVFCRRAGIPLVTTAHWVYKTSFPYNLLSNWGEAALAVSGDIRDYLVKYYGFDPGRVIVTVNGVDTEKFSPGPPDEGILKEFNLDPKKKRVLSVSRLDAPKNPSEPGVIKPGGGLAAMELVKAAPELDRLHPGRLEILIVGDGNYFESVKAAAGEANALVGREMVVLAGKRYDIEKLLNTADIFVNVSRSVLEAMSSATPVILAGNEGYIGILTPDNIAEAAATNFCCRGGYPDTEAGLIIRDITALLAMEDTDGLGRFYREYIKGSFSAERMADDAQDLYAMVSRRGYKYDAVLSGYYGSKNSGDDEILQAITEALRAEVPGARIAVLAKKPSETAKIYGVKAIHRGNIPAMISMLRHTNLLISGGGTLITDITSTRSLMYYLSVISAAKRLGCRTMIYASGIGPISHGNNKAFAANALRKVDLITLRDELSLKTLSELNVTGVRTEVTADAVFGLKYKPSYERPSVDGDYFCVAVRGWKSLTSAFVLAVAGLVDYMRDAYGLTAVFLLMQPSKDLDISRKIVAASKSKGIILERASLNSLLGVIGNARLTVAMRLHTIIYSAKMGTPIIGLSYDPKVDGMMDIFSLDTKIDVGRVSLEKLKAFADRIMENHESVSAGLSAAAARLEEKALMSAKLAAGLILKGEQK